MASAPVGFGIRLERDRQRRLQAFTDRPACIHLKSVKAEDFPRLPSTTPAHPRSAAPSPWSAPCSAG
jgi:hypothetical protein